MNKLHTLILAITFAFSANSQTALSFTNCSTPGLNGSQEITADTNNVVYISYTVATSVNEVSKSIDDGNNFTTVSVSSNNPLNFIALGLPGSVVLFSNNKKSTDGGLTWVNHTLFGSSTNLFKVNNLTAYCYGTNSFKTSDGGINWISIPSISNFTTSSVTYYFNNNTTPLYLGNNETYYEFYSITPSSRKLMNSKNFGSTFSYSLAETSAATSAYKSAIINPNNTSNFLAFNILGSIQEYQLNFNDNAASTTSLSYTVVGLPLYTAKFNKGVIVNNKFIVIDNKSGSGTSNGILRMALPTSTASTNGVNELTSTKITLYPNPCINTLSIANLTNDVTYTITNQLGQTLLEGTTNEQINISSLPTGIYFANFNRSIVIKFIKE